MKIVKKLLVIVVILVVLGIVANIALTRYAEKKLPEIIKAETNFPYNINYKSLDINLWGGSFTMKGAWLAPKENMEAATKNGVFANVGSISVRGFSLWQLYRFSRIRVNSVLIDSPDVTMYYTKRKYNIEDDVQKAFHQVIHTERLEVKNGKFRMLDSLQHPKLRASNIGLTINKIRVDSLIAKENIPVRYRDYDFSCDSLYYNTGIYYNITLANIKATDTSVVAKGFKLIPKHTRSRFNKVIPMERDQFNIQAGALSVHDADWGFVRDTLYVHTSKVVLDKVDANVYRSKGPKDDPKRRKLYSEMLRGLPFDLDVAQIQLKNTSIQYEEQLTADKTPAKVQFSKFYATISNVYSPVNKKKFPKTTIDAQCLFMKSAPLKVNWSFNTMDKSDAFTIVGRLQNIRSEEVNPVSKPLMNATTEGDLKDVRFTLNGNRDMGSGTFAIEYEDLKVDIYKKDGKKKNKLVSAVGNLIVKNDSGDRLRKTDVKVERRKDRSVFNFLWRFVQEGLKQTILPKIITDVT